jgi:hypothetical protein
MAINTDPRSDPRVRHDASNTTMWGVIVALIIAAVVAWLIYANTTGTNVTVDTSPAPVTTQPVMPAAPPSPNP